MKLNLVALLCMLIFTPALAADAIKTMASVLVDLNHFPTDSDKQALTKIVEDEGTESVHKQLAGIISSIAHQASSSDKEVLQGILSSDTSGDVKIIAGAILNIHHRPTDEDIQSLKQLIAEAD